MQDLPTASLAHCRTAAQPLRIHFVMGITKVRMRVLVARIIATRLNVYQRIFLMKEEILVLVMGFSVLRRFTPFIER